MVIINWYFVLVIDIFKGIVMLVVGVLLFIFVVILLFDGVVVGGLIESLGLLVGNYLLLIMFFEVII